jgi:hypothetical protein
MECFTRIFDAYFLSSALHGDNEIRFGSRGRLTYMNCFELVKNYEFSCPFKLRDMNHADKLTRGPRVTAWTSCGSGMWCVLVCL